MWTKVYIYYIFAFFCVIVQYNVTYAKRILIIANIPSYSHQITYRGLSLELNQRGHEIVIVTTNPIKNSSLTNYTQIDLHYFLKLTREYEKLLPYNSLTTLALRLPFLEGEKLYWQLCHYFNQQLFENLEMKKLYTADNEHFDAVIVAQGPNPSLNAFAYKFNAPLIGISSLDVFNHLRHTFGSLILPSHYSNWQSNMLMESNMPFWKRLINFYEVWTHIYYWVNIRLPIEDALAKKYLGSNTPHVEDITKNMSIYLVNRNPVFSYARSEQPNVIFFHGFHIAATSPALPQDLKQFLDDAKEGFIYVSLGSNVRWEDLPNNTFEAFVEGFCMLPYKVVWKYDPNLLPRKFKNIFASKWFPQQSIFAHPNIKAFIYQGGLQSTEEAIYYGIPVIGYPILWDQRYQVRNIVRLGIGIHLQRDTISKESITAAVHEVVNNRRYKNRIEHLSKLSRDIPYDTLKNAAWWVEYVMRHNGAPSLRNNICDDPWYQRYDWDVIGFLAVAAFTVFLISLCTLFHILRFIYRRGQIFYGSSEYYYTKLKKQ